MLLSLIKKDLWYRRWYLFSGMAVLGALGFMTPFTYRGMLSYIILTELFAFGDFIWGSWWGQGGWQAAYVLGILLGMSIKGYESDRGNMEFLLTRNVTRGQVLGAKLVADIGILWCSFIGGVLILYITAMLSGIEWTRDYSLFSATVFACIASVIPYGITSLFAVLTGSKWRAFGLGCLWLLIDSLFYYGLEERMSLTYYLSNRQYFLFGGFPWFPLLILLLLISTLILVMMKVFYKRDV